MKIIITEEQHRILLENIQIIDDILDKINQDGYEKLGPEDLSTLNRYTEWLKSGKKGEFISDLSDEDQESNNKEGQDYTTYLKDGSEFSFRYDYTETENSETLFYGSVKWHGEEWVGLVSCDEKNSVTDIDFVLDTDSFQSYGSEDEFKSYDQGQEKRLKKELEGDYHQVKWFFQEKVIPKLIN